MPEVSAMPLASQRSVFLRGNYWSFAFLALVSVFFLPAGPAAVRAVFFGLLVLPVLYVLKWADVVALLRSRPAALLLLLSCYAVFRAVNVAEALQSLKDLAAVAGLLLAARRLPEPSAEGLRRAAAYVIALICLYVLGNAVYQYWNAEWLPGERLRPLTGATRSVIFAAGVLASALLTYTWACLHSGRFRHLLLFSVSTVAVAMFFLQSRSFIPALVVGYAVLGLLHRKKVVANAGTFLPLAAALLALCVFAWLSGFTDRLFERGGSYRAEIWLAYIHATAQCGQLLGCGWGLEHDLQMSDGYRVGHAHSIYLQHYFWGGWLGLGLTLAALGVAMLQGFRLAHPAVWPLLSGCIVLALDGRALLSQPNERWLLALLPLAVLLGALSRCGQASGGPDTDSQRGQH